MNSKDSSFWQNDSDQFALESDRPSPGSHVDYYGWLMSVFCWDGILPAGVLAAPQIASSLGADRSLTEFLAITMPLLAFFVRMPVGFLHIAANCSGPILKGFQFVVFFVAAIFLVCLDTLSILAMEMNNGRLWANTGDLVALIILWCVYFLAMLFVLFPGRSPANDPATTGATTIDDRD